MVNIRPSNSKIIPPKSFHCNHFMTNTFERTLIQNLFMRRLSCVLLTARRGAVLAICNFFFTHTIRRRQWWWCMIYLCAECYYNKLIFNEVQNVNNTIVCINLPSSQLCCIFNETTAEVRTVPYRGIFKMLHHMIIIVLVETSLCVQKYCEYFPARHRCIPCDKYFKLTI